MTSKQGPNHVVVDGSNIATEGRSLPSLAQLNDAVLSFLDDHPDATVTVVVDATFGHRIDKSEVKEFDAAVANNELVAPPAGAVGRGDAFVLGIAHKANATVLSNDSFQEFHGDYEWLFEEGRLIGGKPVPHVGWVFVPRTPVRGPISRKAVRDSGRPEPRRSRSRSSEAPSKRTARTASPEASKPLPVPTSPPPGRAPATKAPAAVARDAVNDLMPFLEFVEHHPVGTSVNATVESYSSHGAYVQIGQVRGYVPLRLMGDPPPRSAREAMKIGDAVTLVVESFAPARRSIDCAVPHMAAVVTPQDTSAVLDAAVDGRDLDETTPAAEPAAKRSGRRRAATKPAAPTEAAAKTAALKKAVAKKAAAKTAAARTVSSDTVAPKKTAAKKAAAKKIAAKQTAAKQTAAKQAAPEKAPAKQASPAKKAPAKKAPAKKAPAKKAPAKKAPAKKARAKTTPAESAPAKKAAAGSRPATKAAGSAPAPRRRRSAGEPSA